MARKFDVRKHDLHLPDGRVVERKKHQRNYPNQDRFDPLSEEWAKAFNKKRLTVTHPDSKNTSRIVFIKPVKIWAKRPDKYDVYRLDCDQVPKYEKIPAAGWPYQIITVKGKFYVADDNGKFNRYFPPKDADKFSKYINKVDFIENKNTGELVPKQLDDYSRDELREIAKEKGIENYWKYNKKDLGKKIIENFEERSEKAKKIQDESKKQRKPKENVIIHLEQLGGNHWEKYGKNRVYFNTEGIAKMMGYEWSNYNTGNISYAEHKGEKISNSEMRRVLSDLDCRLYYDLDDKKFHWNSGVGTGRKYTEKAIKKLRKELTKTEEK